MPESTHLARFAHVFPKYLNNARWVRSFLESIERAGEDATLKVHFAFVNLSKNKSFTKAERDAARKFAESLLFLVDSPVVLTPQTDRLVRDLFRRQG